MKSLSLRLGAALLWLGSLLLVIAASLASLAIPPTGLAETMNHTPLSRLAHNWDGQWYEWIVQQGYSFRTTSRSSIVFFPAYPLLARAVHAVGVPLHWAMLLTSNAAFAGALLLFAAYLQHRLPGDANTARRWFALGAMGLLPSTFFFHLAYTESLTLLLLLAAMYAMQRGWHPVRVALIIGAATAARSTGLALLLPFAWYLWEWVEQPPAPAYDRPDHPPAGPPAEPSPAPVPPPTRGRVVRFLTLAPLGLLACWGLVGFIAYQAVHFHAPLAFMQAQLVWKQRPPVTDPLRRLINLATGESIWSTYVPGTALYWNRYSCRNVPLLNLYFMNPLFFLGTVAAVIYGRHRRWLNTRELLLSSMLLAIPYLAQSNRQGMVSEARFTAIVFPAYLVIAHLLTPLPRRVSFTVLGVCAVLLFSYATLFCDGYPFY